MYSMDSLHFTSHFFVQVRPCHNSLSVSLPHNLKRGDWSASPSRQQAALQP